MRVMFTKVVSFLLLLAIGYIVYDRIYLHEGSREVADALKGDSTSLAAIRDTISKVAEARDSTRTDIKALEERLISRRSGIRTTNRLATGKSETTVRGDSTILTRVDTLFLVDSAALRTIATQDSLLTNYRSLDSLWARTDTLHHNEITNLNRQIRTVTRMYQQERSKNRLLKIIVIAGAGYGAYKGIQAATK
jgi:CCR4-NOT transcriptional regulation complex NOT5 subunit